MHSDRKWKIELFSTSQTFLLSVNRFHTFTTVADEIVGTVDHCIVFAEINYMSGICHLIGVNLLVVCDTSQINPLQSENSLSIRLSSDRKLLEALKIWPKKL